MTSKCVGGSVFATAPGASKTWKGQSMFMPRISAGYKLGEKTVVKGGYGIFYDTLNAADQGVNQIGYSVTTTNVLSTDFGQTYLLGDPRNGVSPIANPFPVRATGSRFESPIADTLGADTIDGTTFTPENPIRDPRSRAAVEDRRAAGDVRDHCGGSGLQRIVRGQGGHQHQSGLHSGVVLRRRQRARRVGADAAPAGSVTNPFNIANFVSLQTSNPTLYQRMSSNAFFTGTTVQRQQLIRASPQLTGLTYNNLPLGIVKTNSLEITVNHRYSHGLSANVGFSMNHAQENRTVEAYDRVPTLWQPSQNAGRGAPGAARCTSCRSATTSRG